MRSLGFMLFRGGKERYIELEMMLVLMGVVVVVVVVEIGMQGRKS